jgi:hypothetical protein
LTLKHGQGCDESGQEVQTLHQPFEIAKNDGILMLNFWSDTVVRNTDYILWQEMTGNDQYWYPAMK